MRKGKKLRMMRSRFLFTHITLLLAFFCFLPALRLNAQSGNGSTAAFITNTVPDKPPGGFETDPGKGRLCERGAIARSPFLATDDSIRPLKGSSFEAPETARSPLAQVVLNAPLTRLSK